MVSTLSTITAEQRNAYAMLLIKRMLPKIVMHGEGRRDVIPIHQGTNIEWRFLASFAVAGTALTEGAKPSASTMTWSKVTSPILQYGSYVEISDILAHQGIDQVIKEATEALGEQAGRTLHTKLITELSAGTLATNVRYADAVANRAAVAAANILDAAEIRRARRTLASADVPTFDDGTYHALVHPITMESLTADTTIQQVASYGAGGVSKERGVDLLGGTVMKYGGFTFQESTDAPTFTGTAVATVYGSLFYGKDWFTELELSVRPNGTANANTAKLSGVSVMSVDVDTPSRDDPLGQYGTWGWKAYYAAELSRSSVGYASSTRPSPSFTSKAEDDRLMPGPIKPTESADAPQTPSGVTGRRLRPLIEPLDQAAAGAQPWPDPAPYQVHQDIQMAVPGGVITVTDTHWTKRGLTRWLRRCPKVVVTVRLPRGISPGDPEAPVWYPVYYDGIRFDIPYEETRAVPAPIAEIVAQCHDPYPTTQSRGLDIYAVTPRNPNGGRMTGGTFSDAGVADWDDGADDDDDDEE